MLELVLNDCVTDTNDNAVRVEQLDQLGKIRQRASKTVDLCRPPTVSIFAGHGHPPRERLQGSPVPARPRRARRHHNSRITRPPTFGCLAS